MEYTAFMQVLQALHKHVAYTFFVLTRIGIGFKGVVHVYVSCYRPFVCIFRIGYHGADISTSNLYASLLGVSE